MRIRTPALHPANLFIPLAHTPPNSSNLILKQKQPQSPENSDDFLLFTELGSREFLILRGFTASNPMEKNDVGITTEPKGLEASLHNLLQIHHHKSLILAHHTEKAKKDAMRKAERVSDLLVEAVNGGVQDSFVNQKRIEHEIRALAVTITRFMKQTDQWLAATHSLNTALKEIGDFENWMKIMEYDCKSITTAIQNIHQE
uniref:Biogenesis of lysosome-related organelles complex 1 subunit 1 n=2 Tax=Lotus japonicus TaxID=34305 RepID=I3T083_LOTJA|nr:unknown [Lotus japonicus]